MDLCTSGNDQRSFRAASELAFERVNLRVQVMAHNNMPSLEILTMKQPTAHAQHAPGTERLFKMALMAAAIGLFLGALL